MITKGTSPEDGRETIVIVLEHTPPSQLKFIADLVECRLDERSDEEYDAEDAALFNFLCDLEVKGYEAP